MNMKTKMVAKELTLYMGLAMVEKKRDEYILACVCKSVLLNCIVDYFKLKNEISDKMMRDAIANEVKRLNVCGGAKGELFNAFLADLRKEFGAVWETEKQAVEIELMRLERLEQESEI